MRACLDCGATVRQEAVKALDGTYAVVWSAQDSWVCPVTRNEHRP